MSPLAFLFVLAAALTLTLGHEAWRLTSSKSIRLNTFIGTSALGFAAYATAQPGGAAHAAVIAFFVAMIFGGRGLGIYWRSRKEHDLRRPSGLLLTVAATSLVAAASALWWH